MNWAPCRRTPSHCSGASVSVRPPTHTHTRTCTAVDSELDRLSAWAYLARLVENLTRQLARRGQDQDVGVAPPARAAHVRIGRQLHWPAPEERRQNGKEEAARFAGACATCRPRVPASAASGCWTGQPQPATRDPTGKSERGANRSGRRPSGRGQRRRSECPTFAQASAWCTTPRECWPAGGHRYPLSQTAFHNPIAPPPPATRGAAAPGRYAGVI